MAVTLPAYLQELRVVASKKLAKEYGLEDLIAKGTILTEGFFETMGSDPVIPVQAAEDKWETEHVMDGA